MHLLDVLSKLWPIACGLFVIIAVYWRTRSFFFIFHQILKWLGLEGKYTNPDDQKFADDYLDLNKFNLKTGFRLETLGAKSRLHAWMREHQMEFRELQGAGWYFHANKLSFDLPGRLRVWFTRGSFLAFGLFLIATSQFILNSNNALLKVNATGTWFWVGNNEATSVRFDYPSLLRGDAWKIQQGDCRYMDDAMPIKSTWDKNVICHLVLGFDEAYINEAVDSQQQSSVILALAGAISIVCFLITTFWQRRALDLHNRLRTEREEEPIDIE